MSALAPCIALALVLAAPQDADRDRDGLSDFQEVHKYGTDPRKADTDGDGVPDGDWLERREYAYTVRAVVHVLKPVTLEYLDDDFQDARLLDEGPQHVELEVVLYPFSSANEDIGADDGWRRPARDLKPWLEPGPTADWTPALREELLAALEADGVDVAKLSDKEAVERVSEWLMRHAEYEDGFASFLTSFDERGRPYVDDALRDAAERGEAEKGRTLEEQWAREVSAKGMFEHGVRGSCTSSAIYMSGCLRAVGVPTRTVLCIPLIDANDARERDLAAARLEHNEVRRIVMANAARGIGSWTSHTFNEVWVDGRWRRLNYSTLGQGILDEHYLGLMIHVGTWRDWADARMPETVGRRDQLAIQEQLFGGPNPYSTISLGDAFGEHCTLDNPVLEERKVTVKRLLWTDDPALPDDVREGCARSDRFGLVALVTGVKGGDWWKDFLARADLRVYLSADGRPRLGVGLDPGCYWGKDEGVWVNVPFGAADRRDLADGVEYRATARNENAGYRIALELPVTRAPGSR